MEISNAINDFANIYEKSQIPNWIIICSALVPIILSIIVLIQNYIFNKKNEELQKNIQNNEIKMKIYDIIFNCYKAFYDILPLLPSTEEGLNGMLGNKDNNKNALLDMIKGRDNLKIAVAQITMLLKNDKKIIECCNTLFNLYVEIVEIFAKNLIKNDKTDNAELYPKIQEYEQLIQYEKFDKYFEQYLSLEIKK